jgi:hypothetical protein
LNGKISAQLVTFRFFGYSVVFDEHGVIRHSTKSMACSMQAAIAIAFFLIRALKVSLRHCLTLSQTTVPAWICVGVNEVDDALSA